MGTYTTNKELFMPSIGEQGWGTLVNGNFETIDNFLKPIAVSGNTYTFTGNLIGNQSGGSVSTTSISNSGTLTNTGTSAFTGKITGNGGIETTSLTTSSTITSTGVITANGGLGTTSLTTSGTITSTGLIAANGGVKGNVTGNVTGLLFVKGTVGTSGDTVYASLPGISGSTPETSEVEIYVSNYIISYGNPAKHGIGIYTRRSDLSGITSPSVSTRTISLYSQNAYVGVKLKGASEYLFYRAFNGSVGREATVNLDVGKTYILSTNYTAVNYSIPAGTTYYVHYETP